MPRAVTTIYSCTHCDAQHPKWLGQCATCGAWGTLVQSAASPASPTTAFPKVDAGTIPTLDAIDTTAVARTPTNIAEFDTAIGGGLVPGSTLLLSGEPGIGKSTLILQVAAAAAKGGEVLYITGEETGAQIKHRAERLSLPTNGIRILATTDGAQTVGAIRSLRPRLAIIDSVQTITPPDLPPDAGGITQVRALTSHLVTTAKSTGVPIVIIGHVTKDGAIAGPKLLEHLVDQVAVLEGDATSELRCLRTSKNRYGPTDVVGVFTMTERGLESNPNPSAAFLGGHAEPTIGSTIATAVHGNRVLLVEVQALVTRSAFGQPQRRALGMDANKLHVLLAVLAKHGGVSLATADVHIATAAGFRLDDPAADLAILAALASAATDGAPPFDACIGMVGLDGSVRPVRGMERRIQELIRLGRRRILVPTGSPAIRGATLVEIVSVRELPTRLRQ